MVGQYLKIWLVSSSCMDGADEHSFLGTVADRYWSRITAKKLIYGTGMVDINVRPLELHGNVMREDMAVKVIAV